MLLRADLLPSPTGIVHAPSGTLVAKLLALGKARAAALPCGQWCVLPGVERHTAGAWIPALSLGQVTAVDDVDVVQAPAGSTEPQWCLAVLADGPVCAPRFVLVCHALLIMPPPLGCGCSITSQARACRGRHKPQLLCAHCVPQCYHQCVCDSCVWSCGVGLSLHCLFGLLPLGVQLHSAVLRRVPAAVGATVAAPAGDDDATMLAKERHEQRVVLKDLQKRLDSLQDDLTVCA